MKIRLDRVTKGPRDAALPPTTVEFSSGEVTLARAETEQRPAVLGLIASGRMRPDSGSVTIDGATDYGAIRRRIALIDAPEVCEPAPNVTLAGVVAEELMFAGLPSHPVAVNRMLDKLGFSSWGRYSIATVPPLVRIGVLTELAILRKGVEGIVLTSPDRHGGDPNDWWNLARGLASRDLAVLVIAGDASAAAIAATATVDRLHTTPESSADGPEVAVPPDDTFETDTFETDTFETDAPGDDPIPAGPVPDDDETTSKDEE
jgi:hypothetical protein